MSIGIYGIKNKINGKMYIGQSINIANRFIRHKSMLKHNKHYNDHLQRAYNKYGKDNFEFIILQKCLIGELDLCEQTMLNSYSLLYNTDLYVGDRSGARNSFFGKKHTKKSKEKISKWLRENFNGADNPHFGKKHNQSARLNIAIHNKKNKLNAAKVIEITNLLKKGLQHAEIAEKFGISRTVITRISNGKRWATITGGPVAPVVYKNGVRQLSAIHKQRIGQSHKGMKYKKGLLCQG